MENTIACRPGCFDLPVPEAFAQLKAAGIDYVEANLPEDGEAEFAVFPTDGGIGVGLALRF